jgi:hypothetical protein
VRELSVFVRFNEVSFYDEAAVEKTKSISGEDKVEES